MAVRVFAGGGVLNSATTSFTVNAQSPMTLMTWVYASDATAWANTTSMVGVYGPGAAPSTAIQIGARGGTGISVWTWGGGTLVNFATHSPIAQWNHYAVTFDGTSSWILYINGVQVATATTGQNAGNLTQTFINGFPTGGTAESGNFAVDDVVFLTRVLNANEIRTFYNLQGPRDGIFQGVIARYTFDEGVIGNVVVQGKDISSTGANMTPTVGTAPVYFTPIAMCNVRRLP